MPQIESFGMAELANYTPEEVRAALEAGQITLIDVRTPHEYALEHIQGALLSPMPFLEPRYLPVAEGARPIVFHCGSGMRSRIVAQRCIDSGFTRVAHMVGGMAAWKQAGLPYIATDLATGGPVWKPEAAKA
ncbi:MULTISPECIES: rhodanese-like domain-containing protein [Rhodospirillales]|uniref:Rhodanese-related sulfurtransferase, putative n=2 Tax=Rhodospirillales TaxID=204441 RepID=B6IY21_RHOCS|nr:rhodanese-like domain-containing protein [Rhodospirillum centenum]ACJ01195.1 rhodanese-related sulfurtransferase, putative [Rhodospirillum centenum SW]